MDYRPLGSSGFEVSAIALGRMSFGDPSRGTNPWSPPEEEGRPFLRRALADFATRDEVAAFEAPYVAHALAVL